MEGHSSDLAVTAKTAATFNTLQAVRPDTSHADEQPDAFAVWQVQNKFPGA